MCQCFQINQNLPRFLVVKHGNGHTPTALSRNTPIRSLSHHGSNAVLSLGRNPLHLSNRSHGRFPKAFHRRKPLLRCPENSRFFGTPVVGIAMLVGIPQNQASRVFQGLGNHFIGILEYIQSGKHARLFRKISHLIHRTQHGQTILLPCNKVLLTMPRSRMH